jgi:phosphoglycolate phosphatase-like HAD superfamily hydrolase
MRLRQADDEAIGTQSTQEHSPAISGPKLKTGWAGAAEVPTSSESSIQTKPGFDWKAADAYLFDIDGTLLNSRDAVHYFAFHHAVEQVFGLDFRIDGVPVHGNTDVGILRAYLEVAGVPESEWRPKLADVLRIMTAEVERNATDLRPELCPAISELIELLASQGKLLGVASGNLEPVGWAKLRACGLRDRFSFGAFSGTLERRDDIIGFGVRRARELRGLQAKVYVVGDTPADIRSAHANHIPVIAVATGIYSFEELLVHSPEMCISCCRDLMQS